MRAPYVRHVLPPVVGLPYLRGPRPDQTPQEPTAGRPGAATSPLAWQGGHRSAQVPAVVRGRVAPAVPQALSTIRLWCLSLRSLWGVTRAGAPLCLQATGLRTPADLPRLACPRGARMAGGRGHTRGVRHTRLCDAVPALPAARSPRRPTGVRCRRFAHLLRRVAHGSAMDARRATGGGSPVPDTDVHLVRDATRCLARQREASGAAGSGSTA